MVLVPFDFHLWHVYRAHCGLLLPPPRRACVSSPAVLLQAAHPRHRNLNISAITALPHPCSSLGLSALRRPCSSLGLAALPRPSPPRLLSRPRRSSTPRLISQPRRFFPPRILSRPRRSTWPCLLSRPRRCSPPRLLLCRIRIRAKGLKQAKGKVATRPEENYWARTVFGIDDSVRPPHTGVLTCTGIQFS
jgi:hypothetical protein